MSGANDNAANNSPVNIDAGLFNDFKKIKGEDIKIKSVKDGMYSVKNSNDSLVAGEVDVVGAATLKILDRYRQLVESYKTKKFDNVADFFHQIESNREYHARQIVRLNVLEEKGQTVEITKEDLEKPTLAGLEAIDTYIYEENKKDPSGIYDDIASVNITMIELGKWEVENDILNKQTIEDIVSKDVSELPSHIRMLSRVVKETDGSVTDLYPHTVLMNYSHFYPVVLYHTGRAPGEMPSSNKVRSLVNNNANNDDMTPDELAAYKKSPEYLKIEEERLKQHSATAKSTHEEPALPKTQPVTQATASTEVNEEGLSNAEIAKRFNEASGEDTKLSRINIERQKSQKK